MLKYLIITADGGGGRGARGLNLFRFLSTYHGRRAVRMITRRQLAQRSDWQTEALLIGLPTGLNADELRGVRYQRAALFSYSDFADARWEDSDEPFLRSLTDLYFKPWVEQGWDPTLRFGVLPIRRSPALTATLFGRTLLRGSLTRTPAKTHDVSFLGNATAYQRRYRQRVEWLQEIRQSRFTDSFWGGFVLRPGERERLLKDVPDPESLIFPRKRIDFFSFFRQLQRSRLALTPAGNARWSYRHFEGIYAGALLVSTDFRQIDTLIPLPLDNMIHVPDGEPLVPHLERGLQWLEQRPEIIAENIRFLERYLRFGDYARSRGELLERFETQWQRGSATLRRAA